MIKKIGKACISLAIAACLSFATWYFLLIDIPKEYYVQGTAAPVMSKEEALSLLNFHGVRVAYIRDGEWFFDRDGEAIPLKRRPCK